MERGLAGQIRAEQAAPVSTKNSVLPATSRATQGSVGIMRMDQVGSKAKQALGPHQSMCGNFSSKTFARIWGWLGLTLHIPREGAQSIFLSNAPLSAKSTLIQAQEASGWSVQPSWPCRVPSTWWVNQSSQDLWGFYVCFLLASYLYWPFLLSLGCYRP